MGAARDMTGNFVDMKLHHCDVAAGQDEACSELPPKKTLRMPKHSRFLNVFKC